MSMETIWLVEQLHDTDWQPTLADALTEAVAERDLEVWRANHPASTFRIVRYTREDLKTRDFMDLTNLCSSEEEE